MPHGAHLSAARKPFAIPTRGVRRSTGSGRVTHPRQERWHPRRLKSSTGTDGPPQKGGFESGTISSGDGLASDGSGTHLSLEVGDSPCEV